MDVWDPSPNLEKYLKDLTGKHAIAPLVKAAILGTAHLLRRVLGHPEFGRTPTTDSYSDFIHLFFIFSSVVLRLLKIIIID